MSERRLSDKELKDFLASQKDDGMVEPEDRVIARDAWIAVQQLESAHDALILIERLAGIADAHHPPARRLFEALQRIKEAARDGLFTEIQPDSDPTP